MDSALVYRGMDIGTAKPGAALRAQVPHHLIDIIDPDHSLFGGTLASDALVKSRRSRRATAFRCWSAARCSITAR